MDNAVDRALTAAPDTTRAVLSIGSNMEDRWALLRTVTREFTGQIVAISRVYSTPPWGVEDQAEFLNAVVIVEVPEEPLALLRRCQKLEEEAQRVRVRTWGPRTLDVDVVQAHRGGREVLSADPVLTLPHPWAHQRAFVLVPWAEADPAARLNGEPVAHWLGALPEGEAEQIVPLGPLDSAAGENEAEEARP
ncbi:MULTISPECIES: 2-amino-4-hydroxy-6-hydroxymethyldihydropteridine diphosphokinase [unclassified Corynebacterium]|uniref:2-amino-4-hydroxy-6- hydroxymethyldihydropteridine diphosphokinase n=1 Tax=unclassified Corynebacterium TaxID=2624378 RepID=UPI0029CA8764|nr:MULTISPECIES: 2-amino-4-hydroxy-6-hydroxymethyldihydropteridine diphosphokinase [unclassified Corynebacterium]WPF65861.1 2-amino-4-hydroxy-6-hydroxymethyldihydropteridine diphosphokinase [Corynebacterium sp. 22KM0430]WPF68354.1 2-amino-4-hydroxy-6-hydroxymethyldihydropteridine diphosphokinase [Corynebacterium sp. 21KM1197]